MKITIGADPELFVTEGGNFRSAHGLVPGTKDKPFPVDKGAVQVDGMALEYNIDPASTQDEFVANNLRVLEQLRGMIPEKYEFAIVPSCRFNGNHFRAQPKEAKELGCTPDFNAYTLQENVPPDNTTTMRTAAGHIHIGFCEDADVSSQDHMIRCGVLVKQLDAILGLSSLLFDDDSERRKMYGKAGAFRPKPYGVEYRVLSNAWLKTEERMRFVYDMTIKSVNDLIDGDRAFSAIGEGRVRSCIDRSRVDEAAMLMTRIKGGGNIVKKAIALR